jgi:hypothetical protein
MKIIANCKFCGCQLSDIDWAMPAKGKDQYACVKHSEQAIKELKS